MSDCPYTFHEFSIPEYMRGGLDRYVDEGIPPGSFLTAVICNDLKEAVGRADDNNMKNLPAFVNYFYNFAPPESWGTPEKMNMWVVSHEREARDAKACA